MEASARYQRSSHLLQFVVSLPLVLSPPADLARFTVTAGYNQSSPLPLRLPG